MSDNQNWGQASWEARRTYFFDDLILQIDQTSVTITILPIPRPLLRATQVPIPIPVPSPLALIIPCRRPGLMFPHQREDMVHLG